MNIFTRTDGTKANLDSAHLRKEGWHANEVYVAHAVGMGLNVLMEGEKGCGKTAILKKVFAYIFGDDGFKVLNAATMDPYVDFSGIPITKDGENHLSFARPSWFGNSKIKGLIIDEYNRGSKAVINGAMSLVQFGEVNGEQSGIAVVGVAINSHESTDDVGKQTYMVEAIDPAQRDRFQFQMVMPVGFSPFWYNKVYPGKEDMVADLAAWYDEMPTSVTKPSMRRIKETIDIVLSNPEGFVTKTNNTEYIKFFLPEVQWDGKRFVDILLKDSIKQEWLNVIANGNEGSIATFVNGRQSGTLFHVLDLDTINSWFNVVEPETFKRAFESDISVILSPVKIKKTKERLVDVALKINNSSINTRVNKFVELNTK